MPISDVGYFKILTAQFITPFRTAKLRLAVLGKGMEQIRITEAPSPQQMTDAVEVIRPPSTAAVQPGFRQPGLVPTPLVVRRGSQLFRHDSKLGKL